MESHDSQRAFIVRADDSTHGQIRDFLKNLENANYQKNIDCVSMQLAKKLRRYSDNHPEVEQLRNLTSQLGRVYKECRESHILALNEDRVPRLKKLRFFVDGEDDLGQHSEDRQNLNLDTPDGTITTVDKANGALWLDIGLKDGLRTQVTFSVYGQQHQGLARGPDDVKAKIEVVELRETSSIARIVEEDRDRPIAVGDVIFSPAWSAALPERFALVGNGDLNQDGKTDAKDRKILHDLVTNAGGKIDLEINAEGVRVPADGKITGNTKWLIVGDLSNPAAVANDNQTRDQIQAVHRQHELLVQAALEHGIKIVSLKDFLIYMGWKPESRTNPPGANAPFQLKPGKPPVIPRPPSEVPESAPQGDPD